MTRRTVIIGLLLCAVFAIIFAGVLFVRSRTGLAGPTIHDFGVVEIVGAARTVDHAFTLTNTTGRPLHIDRVRTSCSCTKALVGTSVVNPGETFEVDVSVELTESVPKKERAFVEFRDFGVRIFTVEARGRRVNPIRNAITTCDIDDAGTATLPITVEVWSSDAPTFELVDESGRCSIDFGEWSNFRPFEPGTHRPAVWNTVATIAPTERPDDDGEVFTFTNPNGPHHLTVDVSGRWMSTERREIPQAEPPVDPEATTPASETP